MEIGAENLCQNPSLFVIFSLLDVILSNCQLVTKNDSIIEIFQTMTEFYFTDH